MLRKKPKEYVNDLVHGYLIKSYPNVSIRFFVFKNGQFSLPVRSFDTYVDAKHYVELCLVEGRKCPSDFGKKWSPPIKGIFKRRKTRR